MSSVAGILGRIAVGTVALALLVPGRPLAAQAAADTTVLAVAQRQISAFNARDIDAFMALYADDAVVSEFPANTVVSRGKAAIRERYAGMFASLPRDFPPVVVMSRIVQGSFLVEDERWNAPPGERNQAVWMYEIRGGLIRRAWAVR